MKMELIQKSQTVYDYLSNILSTEGLGNNIYELAFKSIEEWIIKSENFFNHERIQQIVFDAFKSDWFLNVIQILSQAITKSLNAKLFLNVSYKQAFESIKENELRFLNSVAQLIIESSERYEQELEDKYSEFCKEMSDLANDLLSNFEIILLEDNDVSKRLLQFVQLMLQQKSRNMSIRAMEFFGEFKDTLMQIRTDIEQPEYLLEHFFIACRISLEKSQLKSMQFTGRPLKTSYKMNCNITYNTIQIDEEDSDDEQENISTYREYTGDIFFNTYHLIGEYKGKEYKEMFERIILEYFEANDQLDIDSYCKRVESAIFASKSIIDA